MKLQKLLFWYRVVEKKAWVKLKYATLLKSFLINFVIDLLAVTMAFGVGAAVTLDSVYIEHRYIFPRLI